MDENGLIRMKMGKNGSALMETKNKNQQNKLKQDYNLKKLLIM
jgi:hypothetical protein